jgi:hypothetical protein
MPSGPETHILPGNFQLVHYTPAASRLKLRPNCGPPPQLQDDCQGFVTRKLKQVPSTQDNSAIRQVPPPGETRSGKLPGNLIEGFQMLSSV